MGASTFYTVQSGKTANEAFNSAVASAQYDFGHSGYTGSIAEKDSFVKIEVPNGVDPYVFADKLIDDCDERIDDKWGPAGCIQLEDELFYFFGWASS